MGRNEKEQAGGYAAAAIRMTVVFALLFSAVCLLAADPLVQIFHLDDAASMTAAVDYLRITCGLILFSYLSQTLTGLFTAQGDSRTPFIANLIGLAVNLVLDPVLILGIGPFPRLEVTGAAIATVAAQMIVSCVMLAAGVNPRGKRENVLAQGRLLHVSRSSELFYCRQICRIGLPTALQGTIYCMISMVLTRFAAVFGAAAVATQRLGGQIESVSWNMADGFGAALNAFVAQNYGAGKMERVKKGYRYSVITVAAWGLVVMLAFLLAPTAISRIFFHEEEAIRTSVSYLRIIALCEPFMCVELATVGALSGLGKTRLCSVISIVATGMRIPLAMILSGTALGLDGVWWALSVTSITKGILFYIAFERQAAKLHRETSSEDRHV
jgi:putative MATE family efflux protein